MSPQRIERLAREFAEATPAVAIVGGAPLAHTNGLFTALAVNALNALRRQRRAAGRPVLHAAARRRHAASLGGRAADARAAGRSWPAGQAPPQVLLVDGANPVFTAPRAWKVREALEKVPFIVSFGSFLDETSALADLILPDHSFLESWIDAVPESGSIRRRSRVSRRR